MNDPVSRPEPEPDDPQAPLRAAWIRGLAAALSAAGMTAELNETAGCLDVTVAIQHPDRKPTDVIADEDGYVEIRWWSNPGATPQQVAGLITSALATLEAGPAVAGPDDPQS